MKEILIGAIAVWAASALFIGLLTLRKYRRRKQFSARLRNVLESSAAQSHRDAVESARARMFEGRRT